MLVDLWDRRVEKVIRAAVPFAGPPRRGSADGTQSRVLQPVGGLVVRTRQDADAIVVVLVGELDLLVVPLVRDAVTRALAEPQQRLIVDLSGLTFIDSSGLHALLDADKRCRAAGRALTIWPGPPNVQLVFELTKTIDCLPFANGA